MDMVLNFLHSLGSFLLIISVIVFIHEYGHYIMARWCGVRVEQFSIGFGREIWGFADRNGTRWKISLLPIGGYVKMFGDASAASTPDDDVLANMSAEEKKVAFECQPLWQKALIVAAGPAANFILAIAVIAGFFMIKGRPDTPPIVAELMPESAAVQAGVQEGDRFVSINDRPVDRFLDIKRTVQMNPGKRLDVVVDRDGREVELVITVESADVNGSSIGYIGVLPEIMPVVGAVIADTPAAEAGLTVGDRFVSVGGLENPDYMAIKQVIKESEGKPVDMVVEREGTPIPLTITPMEREFIDAEENTSTTRYIIGIDFKTKMTFNRLSLLEAIPAATVETYEQTRDILRAVGEIFGGERSVKELGGPVKIAQYSGQSVDGGINSTLQFLAILSINLGLINLFPIPLLDGGHLLFYLVEAISGRPMAKRAQEYGFRFGFVVLIGLMLFTTFNDIFNGLLGLDLF